MSLLILEINVSIFCWQHITDNDIEALVSDEIFQPEVVWSLGDLQVVLRRVPVAFELWHNYFSPSPLRIFFHTLYMQVTCGTLGLSTATVKLLRTDGTEYIACSMGTGPVDAAYKAIDSIVEVRVGHFALEFVCS